VIGEEEASRILPPFAGALVEVEGGGGGGGREVV